MSWHKDEKVNSALIRLLDELCSWERNTGRGSKLFLIPDHIDEWEQIVFAMDGKPVNHSPFLLVNQLKQLIFEVAGDDGVKIEQ